MDQADQIRAVVERGFKGGAFAKKCARQASSYTMDVGPSVCVCVCACTYVGAWLCVFFVACAYTGHAPQNGKKS